MSPQNPSSLDSVRYKALIYTHLNYQNYSTKEFFIDKCDLGLGTFANRDLEIGEVILTFAGPLIDFEETKTRGCWECMPIQIDENIYIDTVAPGVFVNHSCAPNAGIKRDRDLVALHRIQKGEEIRFDYSTTMEENSFRMKCECRHHACRGVIADFSTLRYEKRLEYIQHENVMSFIARKYRLLTLA